MTILRSGSATDVGRIRQVNQDRSLETPNLFAVADGMGGHAGGEVAARVAIESLQAAFDLQPSTEGLEQAVMTANEAVFAQGQAEADLRGMGTTLTAAALVAGPDGRDLVALANVGDSRAYLYSDGELAQVTQDHSLAEERFRRGELSEQEAATDPRRHILTRALGVSPEVLVDLWELHLHTGDRVLLCSDGLCNEVGDDEMAQVLRSVADPGDAAQQLVDAANEHGGSDNITVVVVDVLLGEDGQKENGATGEFAAGAAAGVVALTADGPEPEPGDAEGAPVSSDGPDPAGDTTQTDTGSIEDPSLTRQLSRSEIADDRGAAAVAATAAVATLAPPELAGAEGPPAGVAAPERVSASGDRGGEVRRETRRERRRRLGVPRRITLRVVLFFVLIAGVLVGGYYALRWYANDNWYVTLRGSQLVVYRGYPGGVLWFKPKLVDRTGVTTNQVENIRLPLLRSSVSQPSLSAAQRYVANLEQEKRDQESAAQSAKGKSNVGPTGTLPTVPTTIYTGPTYGGPTTTSPPTTVAPTTTVQPTAATTPTSVPAAAGAGGA